MKRNINIFMSSLISALFVCAVLADSSYFKSSREGMLEVPIITCGELASPSSTWRFVGVPDGMGAIVNPQNRSQMIVTINHELNTFSGITRRHGATGSFVSRLIVERSTLKVVSGEDLAHTVHVSEGGQAIARLCSGDVPPVSALWFDDLAIGTKERMHLTGEETGGNARAFAFIITGAEAGNAYHLPNFGHLRYENVVANPHPQAKTVVATFDDNSQGYVQIYIGEKKSTGTAVERAGLTGGRLYSVRVAGVPFSRSEMPAQSTFDLVPMGDDGNVVGIARSALDSQAMTAQATAFQRPEDGAWDPMSPNDLYFATTQLPRLYRLRFTDIEQPLLGGTLDMIVDGRLKAEHQSFDNVCIDRRGKVIVTSDTSTPYNRVWEYDIPTDTMTELGVHAPEKFGDASSGPMSPYTRSAEFSGQIDAADVIGPGWFLMVDQAHYSYAQRDPTLGAEIVEGGQLLAFYSPNSDFGAPPELWDLKASRAALKVGESVLASVEAYDGNARAAAQFASITFEWSAVSGGLVESVNTSSQVHEFVAGAPGELLLRVRAFDEIGLASSLLSVPVTVVNVDETLPPTTTAAATTTIGAEETAPPIVTGTTTAMATSTDASGVTAVEDPAATVVVLDQALPETTVVLRDDDTNAVGARIDASRFAFDIEMVTQQRHTLSMRLVDDGGDARLLSKTVHGEWLSGGTTMSFSEGWPICLRAKSVWKPVSSYARPCLAFQALDGVTWLCENYEVRKDGDFLCSETQQLGMLSFIDEMEHMDGAATTEAAVPGGGDGDALSGGLIALIAAVVLVLCVLVVIAFVMYRRSQRRGPDGFLSGRTELALAEQNAELNIARGAPVPHVHYTPAPAHHHAGSSHASHRSKHASVGLSAAPSSGGGGGGGAERDTSAAGEERRRSHGHGHRRASGAPGAELQVPTSNGGAATTDGGSPRRASHRRSGAHHHVDTSSARFSGSFRNEETRRVSRSHSRQLATSDDGNASLSGPSGGAGGAGKKRASRRRSSSNTLRGAADSLVVEDARSSLENVPLPVPPPRLTLAEATDALRSVRYEKKRQALYGKWLEKGEGKPPSSRRRKPDGAPITYSTSKRETRARHRELRAEETRLKQLCAKLRAEQQVEKEKEEEEEASK